MAGREMVRANGAKRRHRVGAEIGAFGTTSVKAARVRVRIDGTRRTAVEAWPRFSPPRRIWDRGNQGLRIRVTGRGEEGLCRRDLDNLSEVHDDNARAQQPHHV